jgi:hypothetical protein
MQIANCTPASSRLGDLSKELRSEIWKLFCGNGRQLAIVPVRDEISTRGHIEIRAEPVHAFAICRESREEALRDYSAIKLNIRGAVFSWTLPETLFQTARL